MTIELWTPVTPLVDDQGQASYWGVFKVGDRVRYRYQPECPGVYGMLAPVGHPPEYDGMEGRVYDIVNDSNPHCFLVQLDQGSLTRHVCAAVTELELLS